MDHAPAPRLARDRIPFFNIGRPRSCHPDRPPCPPRNRMPLYMGGISSSRRASPRSVISSLPVISSAARNLFPAAPTAHCHFEFLCHFERSEKSFRQNERFLLTSFVEMTACFKSILVIPARAPHLNPNLDLVTSSNPVISAPHVIPTDLSFRLTLSFRAQREIFPSRLGGTQDFSSLRSSK